MWTERDQIQAYQFLRRRMVSALAAGDANSPVSPSRRLIFGTVMGAVLLLLAAAVFGILGLLRPNVSVDWHKSGQVILEQGSGAHFVFGRDKRLHPVINEASAFLLAGTDKTITVPASALDAAPRGATLGIPGAPDSLPAASDLLKATLVSCSSVTAGAGAAGAPTSALLVVRTGQTLTGMAPLSASRGLLVRSPAGVPYLISGGYRYGLPQEAALVALGYQNVAALPVSPDWLATVPAGRDLGLVAVPGAGAAGPAVGGTPTRVGQVLATTGALGTGADYYLVRAGGLEPISQTEAVLVLADPDEAAAYPAATPKVLQVSEAGVVSAPQQQAGSDATGYPAALPAPANVGGGNMVVVCAAGNGNGPAGISAGPALPTPSGVPAIPTGAAPGAALAGQVFVPPGSGAVVAAQAAPGARTTATYLVTDEGVKFPLASAAVRRSLGYGGVTPVKVNPALLALLPTGPALDAAAARAVVPVGGGG